ncbi:MAG: DUF2059 domain-containing protein [Alphaproteobacteria bacterium]|nr:DUF2059 domain-containing protein [Alphaproteobacteria bacterium]
MRKYDLSFCLVLGAVLAVVSLPAVAADSGKDAAKPSASAEVSKSGKKTDVKKTDAKKTDAKKPAADSDKKADADAKKPADDKKADADAKKPADDKKADVDAKKPADDKKADVDAKKPADAQKAKAPEASLPSKPGEEGKPPAVDAPLAKPDAAPQASVAPILPPDEGLRQRPSARTERRSETKSSGFFGKIKGFFSKKADAPAAPGRRNMDRPVDRDPAAMRTRRERSPQDAERMARRRMPPQGGRNMQSQPLVVDEGKDVDSKALDLGMKVAKKFDAKEHLKGSMRGPLMSLVMRMRSGNHEENKAVGEVIEEVTSAEAEKQAALVLRNRALFFARNYTTDELKDLEDFYSTSAGQKMTKLWANQQRQDAMFSQRVAASRVTELRAAAIKELKKKGVKIPKELEGDK